MIFRDFKDNLGFQMALSKLDDIVFDLNHGNCDWDEYHKQRSFIDLYLTCIDNNYKDFDWKLLYENNQLCNKDFEWFEDQLNELNLTMEKYYES